MKVTVTLENGRRVEADMTLSDFKEFVGVNGHRSSGSNGAKVRGASLDPATFVPPYDMFYTALTEKAKLFVNILSKNPNGISADNVAHQLGFNTPVQIGGMVGGGMGKTAEKLGIEMRKIYRREVRFENGERRVIYKPGPDLSLLIE